MRYASDIGRVFHTGFVVAASEARRSWAAPDWIAWSLRSGQWRGVWQLQWRGVWQWRGVLAWCDHALLYRSSRRRAIASGHRPVM